MGLMVCGSIQKKGVNRTIFNVNFKKQNCEIKRQYLDAFKIGTQYSLFTGKTGEGEGQRREDTEHTQNIFNKQVYVHVLLIEQ